MQSHAMESPPFPCPPIFFVCLVVCHVVSLSLSLSLVIWSPGSGLPAGAHLRAPVRAHPSIHPFIHPSFFSCGATPSRIVPETKPLQVAISLLERVDLRSQKKGILGKKIAWGTVGWRGQKGKKDAQKKVG